MTPTEQDKEKTMKYRKKPVVVEAWLFDSEQEGRRLQNIDSRISYNPESEGWEDFLIIKTLEGDMTAKRGDYIIQGVQGEFYPCKPDIFEATYEKVDE